MTSKRERIQAVISGEIADRPPVALWRHFPVDDQDPIQLAQRTLEFQKEYDFDFIKVTPASSFCVRGWGVEDVWNGKSEGTRDYVRRVVGQNDEWLKLEVLDPEAGSLGAQLACLDYLKTSGHADTPYIQTIFSPLAQAKNLSGNDFLMTSIHQDPEKVLSALEVITQTTISFIEAAKMRGIAGIFYAIQHASFRYFDQTSYAIFGAPFDRRILEATQDLWLNVLHLHGDELMFDLASDYDVQIVNWHDRETPPSLKEGKSLLDVAVCGGLRRWDTLVVGSPAEVTAEAVDALSMTGGGRGHVLGTGCVVPILAPKGNLLAARQAVEA
jgi:uroporphyrinogen decarboxylase